MFRADQQAKFNEMFGWESVNGQINRIIGSSSDQTYSRTFYPKSTRTNIASRCSKIDIPSTRMEGNEKKIEKKTRKKDRQKETETEAEKEGNIKRERDWEKNRKGIERNRERKMGNIAKEKLRKLGKKKTRKSNLGIESQAALMTTEIQFQILIHQFFIYQTTVK